MTSPRKDQESPPHSGRPGDAPVLGVAGQRLLFLQFLNSLLSELTDEESLQTLIDRLLRQGVDEIAFGALYLTDEERRTLEPRAVVGLSQETAVALGGRIAAELPWPLRANHPQPIDGPEALVALPLRPPGKAQVKALFLAGPAAPIDLKDSETRAFFELLAAGLEAALAVVDAEAEGRRRSEFEQMVAVVSHDLRNPLHAIRLSATMGVRDASPGSRLARTFERVVTSANRASRMIADLLDFTSVSRAGGIPIEPRSSMEDLHSLVSRAVDEALITRPERKVNLVTVGECTGAWDFDRIAQVIQNLIGNALQHTVEGTPIEVRTRRDGADVELDVHNGGPPIPTADLPFLFEPFRRGSGSRPGGGRSLGLGLYIARHIVEAHGGTIQVTSDEKNGTSFLVRLPCKSS